MTWDESELEEVLDYCTVWAFEAFWSLTNILWQPLFTLVSQHTVFTKEMIIRVTIRILSMSLSFYETFKQVYQWNLSKKSDIKTSYGPF